MGDPVKLKPNQETINKMKRQPTDWEKIFANDVTHKGLTSKLYKPNQKMGRRPTKTFLQRRHTDGQEAHEKMLNITNY